MPDAQDKMTIAGNWQELVWLCLQEILAEGILPAPYYDRHDRADHNCYCNLEHGLGPVDKGDSQKGQYLIQGSFWGGYLDPGFDERRGMGLP